MARQPVQLGDVRAVEVARQREGRAVLHDLRVDGEVEAASQCATMPRRDSSIASLTASRLVFGVSSA